MVDVPVGSALAMLDAGVRHLDPQRAVFDAMLTGWARQQQARLLADATITAKLQAVRRFAAFTNDYPWAWTPADVEEFWTELRGRGFSLATLRAYQVRLRLFASSSPTPATAGRRSAGSGSARIRCRCATSRTPPPTSPSTKGARGVDRLPARSCRRCSTTPTPRSAKRCRTAARERLPHSATRLR